MMSRKPPFHDLNVDDALKTLVQLAASETGDQSFATLVRNLAKVLRESTVRRCCTQSTPLQSDLKKPRGQYYVNASGFEV
ncbi:MAG: hypothetical protein Kow0074_22490 [Candidatus Zixiibacteriota bacterium]